jgi:putative cofactor-binding repeat protein
MRDIRLRPWSVVTLCLLLPSTAAAQKLATGSGPGSVPPTVRIFDASGTETTLVPYPAGFAGGVRVALGDVNGDGTLDIITGAGPGGGPHVRVWDGVSLSEITGFFAYPLGFAGGVSVAAADVDGDGHADIITGAGPGGGPHVRVWSGAAPYHEIHGFFAYPLGFAGGVTVAAADVDGDGRADIITGAGPGGGPHVRVWSGAAPHDEIHGFFAYSPAFAGGVNVAAADVDGDGHADIITGAGPGGGPHVRVWSGAAPYQELTGFFAYDPGFPGGVVVATMDLDRDGRSEIVTGPATGAPLVRIWSGLAHDLWGEYYAFDPFSGGGVTIGSSGGSSALRFTSATSTAFSVSTAGTFSVTTVGGPVPVLTVTGALPSGVTFTDNTDRTATLTGTPATNTGGSYPLTFTATISGRPPVTQAFTLDVTQAPAITSAAATTFGFGGAGTFTVTTTGFPRPTLSSTGALPSGLTFTPNSDGTATLAGTPAPGSGGVYPLTITAANGAGVDAVQTFTLTIDASPAFTSANATSFTVGAAGSFTVTTTATPPVTAISVSGALPAGTTFVDHGNGTATLSGTPAPGTGGTRTLTFTAANGVGTNAVQTFTLTVRQAPAITSSAATTFVVGGAGTFGVTATGFPTPTLTLTGALPSGVTFTDNGNGTATLAGTPALATGGSYPVSITAANGVGSNAVQSFTLTVNQAPAITSAPATTFTVGTPGTFLVTMSGSPIPTIAVSGSLPVGVTFLDNGNGTGTLSGTPAPGTGGVYSLTFTAANGVLPNGTQSFTLTVTQAPAITSANATTFVAGSANNFTVTTSGYPVGTITIGGVSLPAGVSFVDNGNGTATLSATTALAAGGTYALTFTANNGIGGNVVQSFTLTVNEPPTFTSATSTTLTVGNAGSFTVTTDGFPAITSIVRGGAALPSGVSFLDNADGTATLSGTPGAGTAGAYAITFTINNGVGGNVVQNFTLNVHQAPAITSTNATTFTVGTPGTFTVTATGFPTPTVAQTGTLPTGVTFTPATRVLGGTATQTGVFPIVFAATNAVSPDASQNFTLNVVCPTITVTPGSLNQGLYQTGYTSVDFDASGSTGSSFTWGATGLPAGLSINTSSGVVSGTPTDTVLNGAVAVTVTDNFGCSGNLNTTITVRPMTDNETYTGGVGNTQFNVGAGALTTPNVFVSDNVKTGDNGPGALSVTFNAPSNGSVAEGGTDGTFVYTPNVGFAGPSDTFTYTLTDGNGVTNTGSVIINLSQMVWYVDNTYGGANGASNGQSHRPFTLLSDATTPSLAGSTIYVHTGSGTTTGNLTMDTTQQVFGQGALFTLNGLSIPASAKPTLSGTVTAATGAAVRHVNFSGATTAITASATTGLTVIDVDITGGTTGILLNAVSGTIDFDDVDFNSGGTIGLSMTNVTGALDIDAASSFLSRSGAEVLISGGTGTVSINAPITNSAGRSIDIQGRTGGAVTFAGAISDTGTGILLDNNASTMTFSGGLTLSTGANVAFRHVNGGASIVSGSNNTITTSGATAIELIGTSVEHQSGTHTWRTINAAGAAKGISVQWHDSPFTVTGTDGGDLGSLADAGTGGTISTMTNRGAEFVRVTGAVSLGGMNFTNTGTTNGVAPSTCGSPQTGQPQNCAAAIHLEHTSGGVTLTTIAANGGNQIGINGTNVTNLMMTDIEVANFGNEVDEHGVQLHNLFGSGSLTNGNIHDNEGRQFYISNGSGTLTLFGITNSTFDGNTTAPNGLQGVQLETFNAGTSATVTTTGSVIRDNYNTGWQAQANGNSTLTAHISGTALTNNNAAVIIQASSGGTLMTNIENNDTLTGVLSGSGAMSVKTDGGSAMTASIRNNRIGSAAVGSGAVCGGGCNGIFVNPRQGGFMDLEIVGNIIEHVDSAAIFVQAGEESGGIYAKADVVITGNLIRNPDGVSPLQAIAMIAGVSSETNGSSTCLAATLGGTVNPGVWPSTTANAMNRIEGNWDPTSGGGAGNEVFNWRRFTNTFHLPGLSGDPTAWVTARNSFNSGDGTSVFSFGGSFTSLPTCQ